MRDLTPAPPPCVLAPARCSAPAAFVFLGVDQDGNAGARITNQAGERVGACEEHTGEVMARLAGLPGAPPRIRAVPAVPATPSMAELAGLRDVPSDDDDSPDTGAGGGPATARRDPRPRRGGRRRP